MKQRGVETLEQPGAGTTDKELFLALCGCCDGVRVARVREVAGLARMLRNIPATGEACEVPLLDLARRLVAAGTLGGSEPGAREALEQLLDAALVRGLAHRGEL